MLTQPLALIVELTHRCPLHCVYCSNPLQLRSHAEELPTELWTRVLEQAAELGMFHVHFTGGEPLARSDLAALVSAAHRFNLYTNLITSGIGLNQKKLSVLVEAGLDHLQLSFQDVEEVFANEIAGAHVHTRKVELAHLVHDCNKLAFTVNLVVHRYNLDRLESMISFAESLGPQRIEIASVQFYGWALKNRNWLLPTREQVQHSVATVEQAQERLKGQIKIDFVPPDYYATFPKPCMGGWGRHLMLIDPTGKVLPCHAAAVISGMNFENVSQRPLRWIWEESAAFRRFRGEGWMPEPCRSCERRSLDFGGCRCQAFLITGDANATDPACSLAPAHSWIEQQVAHANSLASSAADVAPSLPVSKLWHYRPQPS
jgi:pyrroloquinoline quinone biosynthesis protein E